MAIFNSFLYVYQRVHILESKNSRSAQKKPADRHRDWPSVGVLGGDMICRVLESVFNLRAKHGKEVIPWTKGEKLKTQNPNH
jgi:hypothetical protein